MNHICYFYILKYRSIHNVCISLDARYLYVADEQQKKIKVSDNPSYVEDFWPKGVASLATIVGNNGAGKTTCLFYLLQALADGSGDNDLNAIIIYKYRDSETLHVYKPEGCDFQIEYNGKSSWIPEQERPTVSLFYYSGYFRPYSSVHEPGDGELAGVYNASDTWKLIKDYQDYSNVDTLHQTETIGFHIDAMRAQDDNRIVMLLRDKELRDLLPQNAIPRYVLVEPSDSGYKRLVHEKQKQEQLRKAGKLKEEEIDDFEFIQHQFGYSKEDYLARIAYANFYNFAAETRFTVASVISLQQEWVKKYEEWHSVSRSLTYIYEKYDMYRAHIMQLLLILEFLDTACSFNKNTQTLYIDILIPENKVNIDKLCNYFKDTYFVVAHFFDLGYAREPIANTRLSSGEFDLLKFFSRLYDAALMLPERANNCYCPQMILVDEAENSYHPEWQRQFINMLVEFTHALYHRREQEKEKNENVWPFQIVLTTHSPILLSDIPRMYVNYLQKDSESGDVTVSTHQPETFGTNVFELYRHAFFMSEGLVGEYARKKIAGIQKDIRKKKADVETIQKEIELIGDPGIRTYLQERLEEYRPEDVLAKLKRKVEELENRSNAADKRK